MKSGSPKKTTRKVSSRLRQKTVHSTAQKLIGFPVLLVLKDGSQYVGVINSIDKDEIVLSGTRGQIKLDANGAIKDQAQVSGLLGMLLGGGLGKGIAQGASGAGALPGIQNTAASNTGGLSGLIPNLRLGMNMLQMIVPLFSGFFV